MSSEFLKCDAQGCDHREDVPEISEDLIGKPCPECGANLLTREDFDFYTNSVRPAHAALVSLGLLKPLGGNFEAGEKLVRVNAHDGALNIRIEEAK